MTIHISHHTYFNPNCGGACKMLRCPLCESRDVDVLAHNNIDCLMCRACGYDGLAISDYDRDVWEFQRLRGNI